MSKQMRWEISVSTFNPRMLLFYFFCSIRYIETVLDRNNKQNAWCNKPYLISFHCKIRNTLHSHFPDNTYVLGEADGLLTAYHQGKVLLAWLYPKEIISLKGNQLLSFANLLTKVQESHIKILLADVIFKTLTSWYRVLKYISDFLSFFY